MSANSRLALVTGASNGIGLEIAKCFARDHSDLILVARSKAKLDEVARNLEKEYHIRCYVIDLDLGRHGSALELYNRVTALQLQPDAVVNNAGFGDVGDFAGASLAKLEEMMTLNMETLTLLTRYFVADMLTRKSGRVLNLASTAAFQPGPYMAVYYATKAFVLSFSEALAFELKGTGVTVTALCPGPVVTGFQQAANMGNAGMLKTPAVLPAEKVAEIGYRAMQSGCPVAVAGAVNRLMAFSTRLAPRRMTAKIASRLNRSHP